MAIATLTIDPAAGAQPTPNEIIAGVNAATDDITRAGSVDPSARPIETDEIGADEIADGSVTDAELSATAARDSLRNMADVDRGVVLTRPVVTSGDFKIIAVKRTAAGLVEADYDDVAV